MEEAEKVRCNGKQRPDLNGNNSLFKKNVKKKRNGIAKLFKDQVTTSDGRVFYPCRFCNKVFAIKKTRAAHVRKCPAKEYILTVDEDDDSVKKTTPEADISIVTKSPVKIDIQQNIVLNEQLSVEEIVSKAKSPPIKITIRRNPIEGSDNKHHFTVSSSVVLKEKNESNEDFDSISQRLKSNSVTIIKQTKEEEVKIDEEKVDCNETTCKECTKEFETPIDLLRHSRKCHSYPKVLMALSEVKKFYATKNRSECPICHKPLKTNFRSAFVKHLHTHTNEMKYSCNVCNKKFRRSDHMKAHEKRHIVKDKK